MRVIGERYQRQEYYLSGLILAGEIFSEVLATVQPRLERELVGEASGRVLLGTVAGDIHDIGKNLMATMLRSFGFTVHDIGIDVPPGAFVEAALEWRPDIVGLSGLITASFASMKATTALLKAEPKLAPPPFVILGGGIVDEAVRRLRRRRLLELERHGRRQDLPAPGRRQAWTGGRRALRSGRRLRACFASREPGELTRRRRTARAGSPAG